MSDMSRSVFGDELKGSTDTPSRAPQRRSSGSADTLDDLLATPTPHDPDVARTVERPERLRVKTW